MIITYTKIQNKDIDKKKWELIFPDIPTGHTYCPPILEISSKYRFDAMNTSRSTRVHSIGA